VSLTITSLAASALLLASHSTIATSVDVVEQTQATGLAEQLMDEILSKRYAAVGVGPFQLSLGPSATEKTLSQGRELYDDIDDFHGYLSWPPEDTWGVDVGQGDDAGGRRHPNFRLSDSHFSDWVTYVQVRYADENDLTQPLPLGQTSAYRLVDVWVCRVRDGALRELAHLRRVVAYVPLPQ